MSNKTSSAKMSNKTSSAKKKVLSRSEEKFVYECMIDNALHNHEVMKNKVSSAEYRAISAKQELNNYKRSNQSISSDPLSQAIAGLCIDSVTHLVNDLSGELKGETLMQKTREVSFRLLKVGTKVGVGVGVGMLVLEVLAANK